MKSDYFRYSYIFVEGGFYGTILTLTMSITERHSITSFQMVD